MLYSIVNIVNAMVYLKMIIRENFVLCVFTRVKKSPLVIVFHFANSYRVFETLICLINVSFLSHERSACESSLGIKTKCPNSCEVLNIQLKARINKRIIILFENSFGIVRICNKPMSAVSSV